MTDGIPRQSPRQDQGSSGSNADKVEQAIDKAGDIIDQKTQGKYSGTVDKVQDAAKNYVDSNRTDKGEQPN